VIEYFNLPSQKLRRLLGSPALRILSEPSRVEALRLSSMWHAEGPATTRGSSTRIGDHYPVVNSHAIDDAGFARELAEALLDPNNYEMDPNRVSTCVFDPGVSFRVYLNNDFIDVLICFKCDQLEVFDSAGRMLSHYTLNIRPGRARSSSRCPRR